MGGKKRSIDTSNSFGNHRTNPKARESDERRALQMANMDVTRLERAIAKQEQFMRAYIDPSLPPRNTKIDPLYDLKGAARPAREFYTDPKLEAAYTPVDIYTDFKSHLYDHPEGLKLLELRHSLAVAVVKLSHLQPDDKDSDRTVRRAVKLMQELLADDPMDRNNARLALLRVHLDSGDGASARAILDKYSSMHTNLPRNTTTPIAGSSGSSSGDSSRKGDAEPVINDLSIPFTFGRALLEHVSLHILEESGSDPATVDAAIARAHKLNPYAIWVLAYYDVFRDCVDAETIAQCLQTIPARGSMQEALLYVLQDGEGDLWDSTEGARELLQGYIKRNSLPLPELDTGDAGKEAGAAPTGSAARKAGTSGDKNAEDADDAFVLARMFMTAIDMLLEEEE